MGDYDWIGNNLWRGRFCIASCSGRVDRYALYTGYGAPCRNRFDT